MSRQIFMIAIMAGVLLSSLASCNKEYGDVNESKKITLSNTSAIKDRQLIDFLNSVDSLGQIYSRKNIIYSKGAKEKFGKEVGKTTVDLAGHVVGRYIGRWVGGTIGSATGNPGLTILGWYAGGKVGPYVCGTLASGIANIWLANEGVIVPADNMEPDANFDMRTYGDIRDDSIGYFHNTVMCKVSNNREKYIYDGVVDIDTLYDDIIKYCEEYGYYSEELATNLDLKDAIIDMILSYTDMARQYIQDEISENEMIDMQADKLITDFSMSEEEALLLNEFSYKVVVDCAGLTDENIEEYSTALNKLIENSAMSDSTKEEAASSAQQTINSTICWKQ